MVVAAAAPLTVVAGTFPIGIAAGNGAAFPASYIVCTAVLLLFAVGFTAMARHIRGAGAFYTYIAHGFGRHVGLGAAFLALLSYTAVQGGVYGYVGASMNELVTSHGGPAVPWYLYALVMMAVVGHAGLPAHRTVRQGAGCTADLRGRHRHGHQHRGHRQGRRLRPVLGGTSSRQLLLRRSRHRADLRAGRLHRLRGHRGLPRRGPRPGAHHPACHLRRAAADRRLLRAEQLGHGQRLG